MLPSLALLVNKPLSENAWKYSNLHASALLPSLPPCLYLHWMDTNAGEACNAFVRAVRDSIVRVTAQVHAKTWAEMPPYLHPCRTPCMHVLGQRIPPIPVTLLKQ